ncbi:hypothetical protein FHW79_005417 [Azospirillum sp. OGB3]|uniref:hypothetical protein n=1 Tax=Azospirillum sp. OGB3 TaxID=2587012 RepID=UPI001606D4C4|nr:hypothetical protein [Azospirillum sp. OGB3]MBB3267752.1 hypothetical protein [Azospirillum sp. OGB3]
METAARLPNEEGSAADGFLGRVQGASLDWLDRLISRRIGDGGARTAHAERLYAGWNDRIHQEPEIRHWKDDLLAGVFDDDATEPISALAIEAAFQNAALPLVVAFLNDPTGIRGLPKRGLLRAEKVVL